MNVSTTLHIGDAIRHTFHTAEFGVIVRTGIVKRVFETTDHRPYCMYSDSRTGQTCDTYLDLDREESEITPLSDARDLFPSNFPGAGKNTKEVTQEQETNQKGHLHGSLGFSLLKKQEPGVDVHYYKVYYTDEDTFRDYLGMWSAHSAEEARERAAHAYAFAQYGISLDTLDIERAY